MPLDDVSARLRELGRLKIGEELDDRPVALDVWRLTSPRLDLLDAAAVLYGGTVAETETGGELTTTAAELDVLLPPQDVAAGQFWELWTAGGLQRRCTGLDVVTFDEAAPEGFTRLGPCACDEERPNGPRACKPTTVLRVVLPDLPDFGVWRLVTRSRYAAAELPPAAEILTATAGGNLAAAVLAIDHRQTKRPGEPPKPFVVPVLRTRSTLTELTAAAQRALSPTAAPSAPESAPLGPLTSPLRPEEAVPALPPPRTGSEPPDPVALAVALAELEDRMLAAGLWHRTEDGRLPLDLAAENRPELAGRPWRSGHVVTAALVAFAQRALLDAAARFDTHPTGAATRRRLEQRSTL